jgi:methylmalonyl-CoA/ethylmalonyl-CoA epimerase
MKILHIDHIGIAVKSMEEGRKFFSDILGLTFEKTEVVEEQKVKTGFFPITDSEIELLESTEPDGPVAKFIESRGEGVQHIAFRVENIEDALKELKEKGSSIRSPGRARVGHGLPLSIPRKPTACWLNYAKNKEREQAGKGERVLVRKGEREQRRKGERGR